MSGDDEHPDKHSRSFKFMLRHFAFENRRGVSWAYTDEADATLHRIWELAGMEIDEEDRREPVRLGSRSMYPEADYLVRIIQCPEPRYLALNYFVAFALKKSRRSLLPWKNRPAEVRYLTLESSVRMIGMEGPPSVLGEWTVDSHLNYGDGPEPSEEAFVKAIKPILHTEAPLVPGIVTRFAGVEKASGRDSHPPSS